MLSIPASHFFSSLLVAHLERRNLRPPVHRSQVGDVAIDAEALTLEAGVTVQIDAGAPEHPNRANPIVPPVGAVQVLFLRSRVPTLGTTRVVGALVHAD